MNEARPLLGGVELGGTKCVCILAAAPDDIRAQVTVPTGKDPRATLGHIVAQFEAWRDTHGSIAALGIASFGPIDLDPPSPTFGYITSTGKPGWRFVDVAGPLVQALGAPTRFDTDVNGAALAEGRWGAASELNDFAYVTVGTGVGVGLMVNGALVHGFAHPELGHMRMAESRDAAAGACPLHRDCIEGYASGRAIALRAGRPAEQLGGGDPVWDLVTHALAQLLHTLVLATAPRKIILGGGVIMSRPELLVRVRERLLQSLNGYVALESLAGPIENYVVCARLGARAGPLGAIALAFDAYGDTSR